MWSVEGRQVIHRSGLAIEVIEGNFSQPMNLSISGGQGLPAPQLALMIREGIDFAANSKGAAPVISKPKRPILKLKK
ncbi:hypothetical protein [Neptuniibacter halophilus]|uniref:hypothetical protein n=1 Tax=Neptuniibacter halophilus TaxID=651666 RepID=UPI002574249C|nr:hypothetical protein [Neptuniibacter halophilus]